jgi:hypothetical protein
MAMPLRGEIVFTAVRPALQRRSHIIVGQITHPTQLGGTRFARFAFMDGKLHNPNANVPAQTDEDPKGDRGHGDKTWTVPTDEQGISNRPGDESESIDSNTAQQRSLGRDEVIEDNTENEENRNVQKDVQQSPEGRTRRRGTTRQQRQG